ncbi:MAG: SDR family NAD(P)-dependent oxidoreductase, partial [Planctomycetes bacterium]|nr:SDR family NAD(P)-dependent oxidoreductase [Planctomycetota bacterium]
EHLRRWLERIDQDSPLDLVIANAGVSTGVYGNNLETLSAVEEVMAINATATMATVSLAAEIMVKHGKGAIAVVSSLAGLLPLASSPAYCAAKSAARMHALALRSWLRPRGVNVTVVCPGYVATPMSDRVIGSKPFLWSADKAAEYIRRKLAYAPREIRFPFPLAVGIRALGLLPHRLQSAILRHFAFTVEPQTASPEQDNTYGMR